jgi:hypothetical protein
MITVAEVERGGETPLADLVRSRRAELQLSLRSFADVCVDPVTGDGGLVGHNWVDRLEKRVAVTPPQLPGLRALGRGSRRGSPTGPPPQDSTWRLRLFKKLPPHSSWASRPTTPTPARHAPWSPMPSACRWRSAGICWLSSRRTTALGSTDHAPQR